jgi:hypothetical protein
MYARGHGAVSPVSRISATVCSAAAKCASSRSWGEQQLAEADDVARYEKYLELLRDAASTGTEAAAVIRRSLESLR